MSDVQQGPDWWLASDGRWYPPQSRPLTPPPPAWPGQVTGPPQGPPIAPGHRPGTAPWPNVPPPGWMPQAPLSRLLSGWLQGLCWGVAALAGVTAVVVLATLGAFDQAVDSGFLADISAWEDLEDASDTVAGFTFLLGIAAWVVLVVWTFKAHRASLSVSPGGRTWGAGWAIGGWFVPLGNLVIPKLVLGEIERNATGRSDGTRGTAGASGWLWWVLGWAGLICSSLSDSALSESPELASLDDIRASYVLESVGFVFTAAAMAFGALMVRRITSGLSPRPAVAR